MSVLIGDFNLAPLGLFTKANKQLAWPGATITDGREDGKYWEIKPGGPDGNFCRMLYPAGKFGTQDQFYFVNLGHPADVVTVKYKFRWVSPLDMRAGPGKQAPAIQWGPNQSSHPNSVRDMITWESTVTSNPKRRNLISQAQSGAQMTQPPFYTGPIVPDMWDQWEVSMLGGPAGFMTWKLNGVVQSAHAAVGTSVLSDSVILDFTHFAGGGGPVNAADMYADISTVTVQIGPQQIITTSQWSKL